MQIIYTCPNCGGDLQEIVLTSNPPQNKKVCHQCGWSYTEPREYTVKVPFVEPTYDAFNNVACRYCSNNPANGGSGICHCILGQNVVY